MAKSRRGDGEGNQDSPRPRKRKRKAGAPQLPGLSATPKATSTPDANVTDLIPRQRRLSHENTDANRVKDIVLGHHRNIMPRHRKLLTDIASLIPHMPDIEINDDRSTFLERVTSSCVIYMEWIELEECVYMWIGDKEKVFKIELLAVFESRSKVVACKNPLLSFSCGFDDVEYWNDFKHILEEIFGSSQDKSIAPDCVYALTRLGETLHFEIYQVLGKENEMNLTKIAPSFSLKPIEMNSGQICLPIFDSKKLIAEECSVLHLVHLSGFVPSSGSLIQHTVEHPLISNDLLLPCPQDISQLHGFNSNLSEFLQRYPATYQAAVLGSNPETIYRDITDSFRVFSRSLILIAGAAIKHKLCIRGLGIEKILVKQGVARLHDVELVPYSEVGALTMFRRIRRVLTGCMPEGIPDDVKLVLSLLKDNPLEAYDLIVHSPVWIPAWDRCHFLEDTYSLFKSDLSLESRIIFANTLQSLLANWREEMEQNSLLDAVVKHNRRMPKGYENKTKEQQEKDREHVKNRKIEALKKEILEKGITASDDDLRSLLTCQEFFASCRHSIVHLPEAATELGLLPMPAEMKNFIISSKFAAFYPLIQEGLCKVKSMTPEQLGLTKYFKTSSF